MKKLFTFVLSALFLASCSAQAPDTYDFYNDFIKPTAATAITAADTTDFKDITIDENLAELTAKLQLVNLLDFQLMDSKNAIVVTFIFSSDTEHNQLDKAREYAFETFWLGKMHTADILPYEDWQYSYQKKDLTVQIYCQDELAIQDIYDFEKLTKDGEKLYNKTTNINDDVVFAGTYIELGDLLNGTHEQLVDYQNIDSIAGISVNTSLRQTTSKNKLIVKLVTEQKQIAPQNLNNIYDAVYERYSFINENIVINLYVVDKGMYYEYSSHIQLPAEQ